MDKLWIKCIVYISISAYIIQDKPMTFAMDYYTEIFGESKSFDDVFTDFSSSMETFYSTRFLRPKRIHLWTSSIPNGYGMHKNGRNFQNCHYMNCLISCGIRRECEDSTHFDVIAFFAHEGFNQSMLPKHRSPLQKYVFVSNMPKRYPILSNKFDGFFNWTWTYKLNSDLMWIPFIVKNKERRVVAPSTKVQWIQQKDMLNVSKQLRETLRRKSIAAAWFTSDCHDPNYDNVIHLKEILEVNYNLRLDIYGKCSELQCGPHNEEYCYKLIRRDYYFYLAFENACSDDYVTEVILRAVQYNAVPIVYGCANYSRFLPDGSYLNAKTLGPTALAAKINTLIHNFDQYLEYFKWTNHYTYHKTTDSSYTNIYCRMCALLNSDKMANISVYKDFNNWWNQGEKMQLTSANSEKTETPRKRHRKKKMSWFRSFWNSPFWGLLYSFY